MTDKNLEAYKYGSGTKWSTISSKMLCQSVCNYTGCYQPALTSYGFCRNHKDNHSLGKNGEFTYER